jgi:hypothetical protein
MLNLATSIPACRSRFRLSEEEVAGPIVATIFTWRMGVVSKLAKCGLTDIGRGSGRFCGNNLQYFPDVFSRFLEPRTGNTRMIREIQGMYWVADGMAY